MNVLAKNNQCATETQHLHATAAECRLRTVESQVSLGFTLCTLAETEIHYDRPDEAIKLLCKLRHHAGTIRNHLDEPNYLPRTAISDLRRQLTQLEKRIEAVESRLRHLYLA